MMSRRCRGHIWAGALLFVLGSLQACAPVKPWERGRLAHDCMQIPVDPQQDAFYGHFESVREGSSGGIGRGGGGCGCN